jgi:F-box interacting protein
LVPSDSTYSNTLLPIVSLDLGTESYQEILPPESDYGEERVVLTLGVLRDCLCIITGCVSHMVSDIWLMKVYGKRESWTKFVSVPHMGYSHYFSYINKVPYISEDNQVLLEFTKMFQSELAVYDPIDSTFKIQDVEYFEDLRLPEIYIESLMSPCS